MKSRGVFSRSPSRECRAVAPVLHAAATLPTQRMASASPGDIARSIARVFSRCGTRATAVHPQPAARRSRRRCFSDETNRARFGMRIAGARRPLRVAQGAPITGTFLASCREAATTAHTRVAARPLRSMDHDSRRLTHFGTKDFHRIRHNAPPDRNASAVVRAFRPGMVKHEITTTTVSPPVGRRPQG